VGFSCSWIAIRGLPPETAIAELGLEIVSKDNEYPEGDFSLLSLASGWTVVWFEDGHDAVFKAPAVALARHGPAVACGVDEHVMISEARGYVEGRETWRVTRDGEVNDGLETSGDLPAAYAAIRDRAIAEQDDDENQDVDMLWEVPPELAKSICGFRHDELREDGETFIELRRARAQDGRASGKPGFFARLFGGR